MPWCDKKAQSLTGDHRQPQTWLHSTCANVQISGTLPEGRKTVLVGRDSAVKAPYKCMSSLGMLTK